MANSLSELKTDEVFSYKYMGGVLATDQDPLMEKSIFYPRIFIAKVIEARPNSLIIKDLVCVNDEKSALDASYTISFETKYVSFISAGLEGDTLPEKFPEYFV